MLLIFFMARRKLEEKINMDIEIIPSILVNTFGEFDEKIKEVEPYTKWVQLDVADGDFAPNRTWGDPVQLHNYDAGVLIEAHLMVASPERAIDLWLTGNSEERDSGISRIYFHYEATAQHKEIIKKIKDAGVEVGIALLSETPLTVIYEFEKELDAILLFAGSLGFYGGKFNEEVTLSKISTLRERNRDVIIEIDGGMNPDTAQKVVEAGANVIVSGSYIWQHKKGVEKAIKELEESVDSY